MGLIDRLRAMFGPTAKQPDEDEVEKEVAVERVQHDIEHEREAAPERVMEGPSSLDDRA